MNEFNLNAAGVKSPCISVCALTEDDICQGCYRTAREITDWTTLSEAEKRVVLKACRKRYQRLNKIQLL